jgi:ubiquinone/menaquinone biosynthesis C-methylase UbiE
MTFGLLIVRRLGLEMSSKRNRAFWDSSSTTYQVAHGPTLNQHPMAWGAWRIPESELDVLGRVDDRDVLELGCGAAQWTEALAQAGAWAIGLDLSDRQLTHARGRSRSVSLVQGDAESLPFRREAFDIVFCDHGATVFASPQATIPEVSRILKPTGLFAFCMSTPIRDICFDPAVDAVTTRLAADYFGLATLDDGQSVEYQLPYGEWIRLFRRHQLVVEDLIELRAPAQATTTYPDFVPVEWARKWPAEHIWKLRKTA